MPDTWLPLRPGGCDIKFGLRRTISPGREFSENENWRFGGLGRPVALHQHKRTGPKICRLEGVACPLSPFLVKQSSSTRPIEKESPPGQA